MTIDNIPRIRSSEARSSEAGERLGSGFSRSMSLVSLPIGLAGRAAFGLGQRLTGVSAERVQAEIAQQTMNQLFAVLGRLKGGAAKLGQAISLFEATLPEPWAGACRETLARLQDAAPAMPAAAMHRALAQQLGDDWRDLFISFDQTPAAAASIGQVHRGVWHDGRAVAVKIQYPGAAAALRTDLNTLAQLAKAIGLLLPGLEVKPLIAELKDRIGEELDYTLEADAQRSFAKAYRGDPDIAIPEVVMNTETVIVSEWLDGTPLSAVISDGKARLKDRAGYCLSLLQFSAPARCGLLHADPHPGNYMMLSDGRLGVLDFGAVGRFPGGIPSVIGNFARVVLDNDTIAVEQAMYDEGFVRPGARADAEALISFLRPVIEPLGQETFTFTRGWLRQHAAGSLRADVFRIARTMNLPPEYLLTHRTSLATLALLCQLGATAPYRRLAEEWQPGFAATS